MVIGAGSLSWRILRTDSCPEKQKPRRKSRYVRPLKYSTNWARFTQEKHKVGTPGATTIEEKNAPKHREGAPKDRDAASLVTGGGLCDG